MAEIKISYSASPRGQIGPRPQRIPLNEPCYFTCADPGTLTVEFLGASPVENRSRFEQNEYFVASKTGNFKFKCILTPPGGKPIVLGDPNDPSPSVGGEIEIGN
jgi:hypothetical protein